MVNVRKRGGNVTEKVTFRKYSKGMKNKVKKGFPGR
jgi:hypothetical protein